MKKVGIIICDDHELVREGLKQIIIGQPEFKMLAVVASGEQLLKTMRKVKSDVVILDISLPGRSGLEILKQIHLLH